MSCIEVLISQALIDSNIIQNESVLINNVLKEFYTTEEIENPNVKWKCKLHIKQGYLIVWSVEKVQEVKRQRL